MIVKQNEQSNGNRSQNLRIKPKLLTQKKHSSISSRIYINQLRNFSFFTQIKDIKVRYWLLGWTPCLRFATQGERAFPDETQCRSGNPVLILRSRLLGWTPCLRYATQGEELLFPDETQCR